MEPPVYKQGSSHPKVSPYFKAAAKDWSLNGYLHYRHPRSLTPRTIVNNWTASLQRVAKCSDELCCSDVVRGRASILLEKYHGSGLGAEKRVAKEWLAGEQKRGRGRARQEDGDGGEPSPKLAPTIYNGPVQVFQGDVRKGIQTRIGGAVASEINMLASTVDGAVERRTVRDARKGATAGQDSLNGEDGSEEEEEEEEGEVEEYGQGEDRSGEDGDGDENEYEDDYDYEDEEDEALSLTVQRHKHKAEAPASAAQPPLSQNPTDKGPRSTAKHTESLHLIRSCIDSSNSWTLSSKTSVESTLYNHCALLPSRTLSNSLLPHLILDTTNSTIQSLFSSDDWAEILQSIPPLPEADALMVDSCVRFFDCQTLDGLREVVDSTTYRKMSDLPDYHRHFDARWAETVIRGMLELWENPNQPLRKPHLENWFNSYLWSGIIDRCFLSLPNITVERSEASCKATATRLNKGRKSSDVRVRSGPRLDVVVRTMEEDFNEFAGMEVARGYAGGETSSKWLDDSAKLARALKDMLDSLHRRAGYDEEVMKNITVVGVICNGLKIQMVRMGCYGRAGGVAVMVKDDPMAVPVEVEGLQELLVLLAEVSRMKRVVGMAVDAVRCRHHARVRNTEELIQRLLRGKRG